MTMKTCELCNGEASVYCESDSAFLCWNCDTRVHEANFLVTRHVRKTICVQCKDFDGNCISGVGFRLCRPICRSCLSDSDQATSEFSSSSTCVSTVEESNVQKKVCFDRKKPAKIYGEEKRTKAVVRPPRASAEGILVNWCRRLGLNSNCISISLALHALSVCSRQLTCLPFRVAMAASLWFSWRRCTERNLGWSTCQNLKRVADVSGVPVRLILEAEKKISRVLKSIETDLEEGWAECSD